MLAIRLPEEIENRLSALAAKTGRTKTFYAKEAILNHLDEMEDKYLSNSRLNHKIHPIQKKSHCRFKMTVNSSQNHIGA